MPANPYQSRRTVPRRSMLGGRRRMGGNPTPVVRPADPHYPPPTHLPPNDGVPGQNAGYWDRNWLVGPTPVPSKTNEFGYDPIRYGANNEQTGIAKVGQARNQPGFIPRGQRDGVPNVADPANPYDTGWNNRMLGGQGGAGGAGGGGQGDPPRRRNPKFNKWYDQHITPMAGFYPNTNEAQLRQLMQAGWKQGMTPQQLHALLSNVSNNALFNNGNPGSFDIAGWLVEHPDQIQATLAYLQSAPGGMNAENNSLYSGAGPLTHSSIADAVPGMREGLDAYFAQKRLERGGLPPRFFSNTGQPVSDEVALMAAVRRGAMDGTAPTGSLAAYQLANPGGSASTASASTTQGAAPTSAGTSNYDPKTDPVALNATQGYQTPQAALVAGKDPTKDVGYWFTKGWNYNPANDQWTQSSSSRSSSTASPWPLDPQLEAQRRLIEDQYQASTQGIPGALDTLGAQGRVATSRMGTNEGITAQNIRESMAGRGTFNSSLYANNLDLAATDFARQRQDLAAQLAQGYGDIYGLQSEAQLAMSQQLQELLMQWAQDQAQSQYAVTPSVRTGRRNNRRNNRRGRR